MGTLSTENLWNCIILVISHANKKRDGECGQLTGSLI